MALPERALEDPTQAVNKGGTVDAGGIKLTLTHANHSSSVFADGQFHYTGESCGFVIEVEDGFKLYYSGDTNVFGDLSLIGRIYAPDVAILPIGDHFTMGPREAAVALELLGVIRCVPATTEPSRSCPGRRRRSASWRRRASRSSRRSRARR